VAKTDLIDPTSTARSSSSWPMATRVLWASCSTGRPSPPGGAPARVGGAGLRTAVVFVAAPVSQGTILPAGCARGLGAQYGYSRSRAPWARSTWRRSTSMAPWLEELRIFAGYRVGGWPAGGGAGRRGLVGARRRGRRRFSDDPSLLWKRVLRRQGGALAVTAAYPPDPRSTSRV